MLNLRGHLVYLAMFAVVSLFFSNVSLAQSAVGAAETAAQGSVEVPLMTGNLGRSGEATNIGVGAISSGLNGGVSQSVGGLGVNQGKASYNQTGQLGAGAQSQNVRAELGGGLALGATQFQQFVQNSTGKFLSLYGYNLFDRSRFPSVNEVPVPANYVLGPGDEIDIKIWGAVDIGIRLPVDRQGQITLPKVGPISVAGIKASELDTYLKKQISKVYANFELNASVGKLRSIQIFVVGQARNPGAYTVSSLSSLVSAIFESGGPSTSGSMRKIELMRSGAKVAIIDLYKFIQAGDTAADTRLLPGDIIVIPPAGPRVALTGALDNPFIFELSSEQESVEQILGYSASSTLLTTPHKMLVERIDNQKTKGPREVEERILDSVGLKSTVRDGDILTFFRISPQFANAVTLRGNVASPLRYSYKAGMKVSDLIPENDALILGDYYSRKNILVQYESGRGISVDRAIGEARGSLNEINWEYASIERMNNKDVTSNLLIFNLGKAIKQKDPAHNLELHPGDVVTIYSVNDIPVAKEMRTQFVKVSGEVKAPGIYQIKSGDKMEDVIQMAGGLAKDAYLYGTIFTRESTRAQQQANLDLAIRKLESQITSQTSRELQNVNGVEGSQNLQNQLAGQRLSIDRLRSLRASGRIALELEPENTKLPTIDLEDGDVIFVPSKPSFVSVFGSVLVENTFIHKKGATVAHYLDRAGPTRDADIEAAMLIRSDGTVISNRAQRNWFGIGNASFMSNVVYSGDSVFVPEVIDKRSPFSVFIQGAKDWSQLFYQFGLGAAAIKTLRN